MIGRRIQIVATTGLDAQPIRTIFCCFFLFVSLCFFESFFCDFCGWGGLMEESRRIFIDTLSLHTFIDFWIASSSSLRRRSRRSSSAAAVVVAVVMVSWSYSHFFGEKSDPLSRPPLSRSRPLNPSSKEEEVVVVVVVYVAIERVIKQKQKKKPHTLSSK